MVVHMLRLRCSVPGNFPIDRFADAMERRVSQHQETLEEQRSPLSIRETVDGMEYCAADYRFEWEAESGPNLMRTFEAVLQKHCDWLRIRYHVCDHDEDDRGGCEWDDVIEYGPIPDEI